MNPNFSYNNISPNSFLVYGFLETTPCMVIENDWLHNNNLELFYFKTKNKNNRTNYYVGYGTVCSVDNLTGLPILDDNTKYFIDSAWGSAVLLESYEGRMESFTKLGFYILKKVDIDEIPTFEYYSPGDIFTGEDVDCNYPPL